MIRMTKAAFLAVLLAGASTMAVPPSAEAATRGGTLTYGRYADSIFLDPVFANSNPDIWVLTNLYDTLLLPSDDGKGVVPGLATSWTVSPDGKTVTLTLRDGIEFSDGSPITPADVKWSLDRARKPDNGIWGFDVESIDAIETGAKTVTLKLKHPDPAILAGLTVFNTAILPQKAVEAAAGGTDEEKAKSFAEHPVVSGAYILQSWDRGSTMKLVRNPHYWQKGEDGKPLPYLDGITFEVIPDDATRILKLQSGELDGAEFIPYARVAELQADPDIDMELLPSTRVTALNLNVRPKLADGSDNPLAKAEVRQALNYATEKNGIIQIVTHGVARPSGSFMSSSTPLYSGTAPVYPYDPDKAKALLAKAGYPNGVTLTLDTLAGNQDQLGISTALQQMWSQIGVKLNIEQVDNATRLAHYTKGNYSAQYTIWTDDIADPNEITSYFAYFPHIQSLHSGWNDDEVNKLFVASQSETDAGKRAADYKRIQEIYNQSGPLVYLYESPYAVALRKSVKGFRQIPLGFNDFQAAYIQK